MMSSNGNIFCGTGLLCGEFTGHQWIPGTRASDVELWCFLWSAPEPTFEQTIETSLIWDAIVLIMTSLLWNKWLTYPLLVIRYHVAVLKIKANCHAWDLWKLALSCKQSCLLGSPDLRNLPGTALLSGFPSSWGAVPTKYSLISNIGPVRIWNHCEARN